MTARTKNLSAPAVKKPITHFGPDFPFAFDDWISHPAGLGTLPPARYGEEVAIVGAGMAGMVAAYELMKLGFKPVLYESSKMGGRLRSQRFDGTQGVVAELGGMRFPVSSTAFYHYVNQLGLQSQPFPNPLTPAAGSTVIDLDGQSHYAHTLDDLPPVFREVADAWAEALETDARFSEIQNAIRERDVPTLKRLWNTLVPGRPYFLQLCRQFKSVFTAVVSPPRNFWSSRLWHRRLGLRLSQLHVGNHAGGDDQLR
jgi:monoamine oxidase